MGARRRLSADERQAAILAAAVPLFASKGFDGVTTRELASAADVSEALLYKHFPSKEALYAAIPRHLEAALETDPALQRFAARPATTEKLVLGIHLFISHMAGERTGRGATLPRLMLRSLLEDGAFARTHLERFRTGWFRVLADAFEAAQQAGDLQPGELPGELDLWLVHHVGFALRVLSLPARRPVDHGVAARDLVHRATRFVLRGIGLSPSAIRKYHRPERLERLLA
jgi:AcrR family transcriptional regulator